MWRKWIEIKHLGDTPKELGVSMVTEVKPPNAALGNWMDAMPITETGDTGKDSLDIGNVKSILDLWCSAQVG